MLLLTKYRAVFSPSLHYPPKKEKEKANALPPTPVPPPDVKKKIHRSGVVLGNGQWAMPSPTSLFWEISLLMYVLATLCCYPSGNSFIIIDLIT